LQTFATVCKTFANFCKNFSIYFYLILHVRMALDMIQIPPRKWANFGGNGAAHIRDNVAMQKRLNRSSRRFER